MKKWLEFLNLFSEKNQHLTRTEILEKAKISFIKLKHYYEQYGGGNCTLCGSPDTNKSTCPQNPEAKNPNSAKHPNAQAALVRANSLKPLAKKGKTAPANDERGCKKQTDEKYKKRPSPPFPANQCCGEKILGNDGNMYESRADKNGTCRWILLK